MYKNPKRVSKEVKMMFFYLMDGVIVVLTFGFGNIVMEAFNLSPAMELVGYALFVMLGIWFCFRSGKHPVDRNINMVIHLFRSNRNRYHEIHTEEYDSLTKSKGGKS